MYLGRQQRPFIPLKHNPPKPSVNVKYFLWSWCLASVSLIAVVSSLLASPTAAQVIVAEGTRDRLAEVASNSFVQVAQSESSPAAVDRSNFLPGRYLFGEAAHPDELGKVYAVFAVDGTQVTGAFYMPQSSFDCFRGQVEGDRLSLMVRSSYEQTVSPYAIALLPEDVASRDAAAASPQLAGFHRIATLSENDQRILDVCQAETW